MISIIIPVHNESAVIANNIANIKGLCATKDVELILVDGGSTDDTVSIAQGIGVVIAKSEKGRAKQMNYGARLAKGEILYFLHADSMPPKHFDQLILNALNHGATSGCFKLSFDYDHWFLTANSWFTRFDVNAVRFGDQSLFVSKSVFERCCGFRENLLVMEDQEIISRIKKFGKFVVINDYIITSARKYLDNGIYRMQGIFFRIWALYYLGYSQEKIVKVYKKLILKHKL